MLSSSFLLILDDEEETAEGEKEGNEVEDEELDPLDAYMEEVKEEVKKFNMRSVKGGGSEKVKSHTEISCLCLLKIALCITIKMALEEEKEGSAKKQEVRCT